MRVGLTGGIGCGKSTVVELFKQAGWQTIDTDQVVAAVLDESDVVRSAIMARWDGVIGTDGRLDRKAIAARVFDNDAELRWLEGLLQPLVRQRWLGRLEAEPGALWLVEIPLLFEKRLETQVDLTVCVSSSLAVILRRMQGRGYTEGETVQRLRRQMPLEEKMSRADYVIFNAGSTEFLQLQTTCLIAHLSQLIQSKE